MAELLLRDIPESLYERLKQKAIQNRRPLDSEVIASLELIYGKRQTDIDALLQRARALRGKVFGQLTEEDLYLLKNQAAHENQLD
jgi:hypothetical protein